MLPSERAKARKQKHSSPPPSCPELQTEQKSIFSPKYQLYGYRRPTATDRPRLFSLDSALLAVDTLMKIRMIFRRAGSVFSFSLTGCDASYSAATPQRLTTVRTNRTWSGAEPFVFGGAPDQVHAPAPASAVAPVAIGRDGGSLYEPPFGFY